MQVNMTMDGQIESWRKEISGYLEEMRGFQNINVDTILRKLSGFSARASQIRMTIVRTPDKRAQTFRTQEVDYFLSEVDRQFKVWSRVASLMQTEWEISQRS